MTLVVSHASRSYRSYAAPMVGLGSFIAFVLLVEVLIRIGVLNRFIIPAPSEIIASFGRLFFEENIVQRFVFTAAECIAAGIMITLCGVTIGVVMQRFSLLQRACETWVAAFASAPLVLAYPLFMVIFGRNAWTIIMMGFFSALPPVILKTIEGISSTRKVLVNVGRSFNLTAHNSSGKSCFPRRCRPYLWACGLD